MIQSFQLRSPEELQRLFEDLGLFTRSGSMTLLLQHAYKAACVSDVTLLLEGETGTGKQVLAQAIHCLDQKRARFPFVTVHCSTVSEALAESELFGHRRGAFSGAVSDRPGLFQTANQGTLFLDDVNDLPLGLQPKLLDVMQRGVVRAVGSDREVRLDFRIIAACNQPLLPLVRENHFREDLYHRLNVIKLSLPPLRERREDLAQLVLVLAKRHEVISGPIESIETDLLRFLETLPFLGNIRELENAVQRMLFAKTGGSSLTLDDWHVQASEDESVGQPDLIGEAASNLWKAICQADLPFARAVRDLERKVLETALRSGGGTRREIAKRLQTSERTLYHKMRNYHLAQGARS